MKKYYLLAVAALALASCTSDEFLGETQQESLANKGEITFGTSAQNMTRATEAFTGKDAAEKLNNNFIVYGFKVASGETEGATDANTQKVFNLYNVNYTDGTANTTESNTSGWEYVGYANHDNSVDPQTIKYWDYSAAGYVFSAVSGTGITATKIESATADGATVYDKGWNVTIPQGGSLSDLYASNRLVKAKPTPAGTKYDEVTLTFYNMATKVRFAIYEIIPGYSVKIDKFYYTNSGEQNSETNFAIDGTFKNLNTTGATDLKVVYYDNSTAIENRPKLDLTGATVNEMAYGVFGTNIQATAAIGTVSNEATYDQNGGVYTSILPFTNTGGLSLKVDYTLTSTDNSGETIKVTGATAKVPANYTDWKPNFAYTYIFKISDNTNGYTGGTSDPAGLYPITFDAEVSKVTDGIQEVITSVTADPSITTYAEGVIVTENNEYTAGNIYFTNNAMNVENYKVYEVNNYGKIETSIEEVVANWKNNYCVLTEVTATHIDEATNIPLSDGTVIATTANQAGYFAAAAGKVYVIANKTIATATALKVVKVAGTVAAAPTYTQSVTTASISATDGKAVYKLVSNSPVADAPVLGAIPSLKIYNASGDDVTGNFTITDKLDGTYEIALTTAAIAAGANGTYTVKFNGEGGADFTVGLTYALDPAEITVVAGNATGANTVLKVNTVATDGDVINANSDITVEKTANVGEYKVTAAKTASGTKTLTIGGQTLTVNVDSYSFSGNLTLVKPLANPQATGTITLNKNGNPFTTAVLADLTGYDAAIASATVTDGVYTFTTVAGGTYTITKENASATVTVKAYTMTAPTGNVTRATGSKEITVKCNGTTINAATANVECTAQPTGSSYSLTTNGQTLMFANATVAGTYTFQYKDGSTVVAEVSVVVE